MYELSMKKILFFLCGGDGSGFCLASIRFFGKKSLGKTVGGGRFVLEEKITRKETKRK